VSAGATTPARFAKPFCSPVHFPVACEPASVWENANGPARAVPQPIPTATKHNRYHWEVAIAQPESAIAAIVCPIAIADLRTRVGV
jgi:hypothetical protein